MRGMNDTKNMQLKPIFIREQIIKSVRDFFTDLGFHEVIIPVLNTALPLEQNIYPFKTTWDNLKAKKEFYLTTSPEAYLKKMISLGMGNCFGIGHSFRNLEDSGSLHNPEFLMLEWYREDADYKKIMKEVRELIIYIHNEIQEYKLLCHSRESGNPFRLKSEWIPGQARDDNRLWSVLSLVDLFQKYAKLNLAEIIDDQRLIKAAKGKEYEIKNKTWEQIFNQIFLNEIEAHLPKDPFFLIDYPTRISTLCAKRKDKPYLAERFELYINGIEIGNGNTENTDTEDVVRSMKREEKYRKKMGILSPPIDTDFIKALDYMKNKKYAGIGLGVDRLAMILTGSKNI